MDKQAYDLMCKDWETRLRQIAQEMNEARDDTSDAGELEDYAFNAIERAEEYVLNAAGEIA